MFKQSKPFTPSQRNLLQLNKNYLQKKPILKTLICGKKNFAGRNNSGQITAYHRGGGVKRRFRKISFNHLNVSAMSIVCSLEHDPNRSAFIASVYDYSTKTFAYILAPRQLTVGDIVSYGQEIKPSLGSSLPLSQIPVGTYIYNVSLKKQSCSIVARSAGTFAILRDKSVKFVTILLPSGLSRKVSPKCFASIGEVSNTGHLLQCLGKAGRSRWLNHRPVVRGVAMNPTDHPHGGGEGKKSGISKTPWGKSNLRGKTGKHSN